MEGGKSQLESNMITQNYIVVSPAYGRDYPSGKLAKADSLAGKDFKCESILPEGGGTYCSINDFSPGLTVEVRFKRLASVVMVKVP